MAGRYSGALRLRLLFDPSFENVKHLLAIVLQHLEVRVAEDVPVANYWQYPSNGKLT